MAKMKSEEQRALQAMNAGSYEESARLFEPLAKRGSELALINLGWMHHKGHLGASNLDKAISYYERAVNGGSAQAKHYLGRALMEKGDLQRARAVFIKGADQRHVPCMFMAGKMLVRGQGGETDTQAGTTLLVRAAENGDVFAQRELLQLEMRNAPTFSRRIIAVWKIIRFAFANASGASRNKSASPSR